MADLPNDFSHWEIVDEEDSQLFSFLRKMLGEKLLFVAIFEVSHLYHSLVKSSSCISVSASTTILSPSLKVPSRICMASWSWT